MGEGGQKLTFSSAYSRFTKKDLAMSAVATRDIEAGEEITISCKIRPVDCPGSFKFCFHF
jgi:hypothetical protein